FDDQDRRAELLLDRPDERTERLGLFLRNTGCGLVEQQELGVERDQRGQLDDAPRAGRQLGQRVVGIATEAQVVDDLVGFAPFARLLEGRWGQIQDRGD